MPFLHCSKESDDYFSGIRVARLSMMPSFTMTSKETLDWSWGSVEIGPLMMQVSVQSTCTFSHLSPWNKQFHFTAKPMTKWEATQDVPHKDLLLSEEWNGNGGYQPSSPFIFMLLLFFSGGKVLHLLLFFCSSTVWRINTPLQQVNQDL